MDYYHRTRSSCRRTGTNNFLLSYLNTRDYHNDDPYKHTLPYLNPPLLYLNLLDYHNGDAYKLLLPYQNPPKQPYPNPLNYHCSNEGCKHPLPNDSLEPCANPLDYHNADDNSSLSTTSSRGPTRTRCPT